jgi:hypothetical protein
MVSCCFDKFYQEFLKLQAIEDITIKGIFLSSDSFYGSISNGN